MITCPWCGTSYTTFQENCSNCGGQLPIQKGIDFSSPSRSLPAPPPAPRDIPDNYIRRALLIDGWTITAGIFVLLGAIFTVVGGILTLAIITAMVGLPFVGLGLLFLLAGIPILVWRYQTAQQKARLLSVGEAALGHIESVYENTYIRVNNRFPWTLTYRFQALGDEYEGKIITLTPPGINHQPSSPVYILYLPENPEQNTLYPPL